MNENFFDQKEFLDLCKANRIEPMITGNQQLVLMCPKHPGKDIEEKFKTMIPEEVPWVFSEGLSQTTVARIKVGLFSLGLDRVMLQNLPGHRVVIDVISRPDNSPKKGQFLLTLRTSPLWDLISGLLKKDPFVETFAIRFNGTVVRDSSQYVGEPSPIEGAESPFEEEGYQPDTYEQFGHKSTPTPIDPVKDERFDYERPFLPEDVVTDVKILLETTGSVEEFLKSI